jgi:hypothetical protein
LRGARFESTKPAYSKSLSAKISYDLPPDFSPLDFSPLEGCGPSQPSQEYLV